jgi:hypothetical protein
MTPEATTLLVLAAFWLGGIVGKSIDKMAKERKW